MEKNLYHPAEWEKHKSCWLAWPSHGNLWKEDLEPARKEFVHLCRTIADVDHHTGHARGENLEILIPPHLDTDQVAFARRCLEGLPVRYHYIPFGDIWLRDTAPIFLREKNGATLHAKRFAFNGWGGKYSLPHDTEVSSRIAEASGLASTATDWILEGGSIEMDGEGTCLTTRQCLLNSNRNAGITEKTVEEKLLRTFSATKTVWIDEGLLNDHTDGHIDTIARFAGPGVAVCMEATSPDDPNRKVYEDIARALESARDAQGRKLKVARVPSPGRIETEDGRIMPASYLNFYVSNTSVAVPVYGAPNDDAAVEAIAKLFPGRKTVGLSAIAILTGGGAFHCITQQQPVVD